MIAECASHQIRGGELVDRLTEGLRQRDDPLVAPLLGGQVVEVPLHRRVEVVPVLDPLEPSVQQRCEGEVRIAGRIGTADLGPGRLFGARLVERDPDQGRPVALRPGDVDRRLEAGHQALV